MALLSLILLLLTLVMNKGEEMQKTFSPLNLKC